MTVILDCTELHGNPIRTGIQRVVRELIRHWPAEMGRFEVARFEAGRGLVAVDATATRFLLDEDGAREMDQATLRAALAQRAPSGRTLDIGLDTLVFIPEVFFDPERALFHDRRLKANPGSLAMLGYDFLPWLRPELFGLPTVAPLMGYLRLIRDARHVSFISVRTQREYATRLRRSPAFHGPVLPLGADGLQMERQSWCSSRRDFVALGSIDGRKNQHCIFEAFRLLWDRGLKTPLTLVGRAFGSAEQAWLHAAESYPHFRWIDDASDDTVAQVLRDARATIYVSDAEGFGLPPVESLMIGIPVIATAAIPSVEMLPPGGHVRLSGAEPALIAAAVTELLDDNRAEALWAEAAGVRLGTWHQFGVAAARWLQGIPQAVRAHG